MTIEEMITLRKLYLGLMFFHIKMRKDYTYSTEKYEEHTKQITHYRSIVKHYDNCIKEMTR